MSRRRGNRTKKSQRHSNPEQLFDDPMTVSMASDFPAGEPDFEADTDFDEDFDDGSYGSVVWDEGADIRHLMRIAPRHEPRGFTDREDWD